MQIYCNIFILNIINIKLKQDIIIKKQNKTAFG